MKGGASHIRYGRCFFSICYTGFTLALMVLGACDGGVGSPEFQGTDAPAISLENTEGELVRVQVALPQQGRARNSVNPAYADVFVELYEVVFANAAGTAYYRGEAAASQGYITVDVPVGAGYQVLLLAGRTNRTLLGAGYVGGKDIEAGKENMVSITVSPVAPVWDGLATLGAGNDFTFAGTGAIGGLVAVDAVNRCVRVGSDTVLPAPGDTLEVTFNLRKLQPLIDAQGGALTLQGSTVQLLPRNVNGPFLVPVDFTTADFTAGAPITGPNTVTFTNGSALPAEDVDGLLDFELTYQAFGVPASGGNEWLIRNGLIFAEDTPSNSGGRFIVQIGRGSN
ncbi:hypothetical protein Holit_03064 [Hollandina sp. SP2]